MARKLSIASSNRVSIKKKKKQSKHNITHISLLSTQRMPSASSISKLAKKARKDTRRAESSSRYSQSKFQRLQKTSDSFALVKKAICIITREASSTES